jgi:hypothetical protein
VSILCSHLRYNYYLQNPIVSLIELFTILTGTLHAPLEDTSPIIYVNSPWMQTLRQLLHKNNIQIEIPNLQTLHLLREFNQPIVNPTYVNLIKKSDAAMVNACRLFLLVTTLANFSPQWDDHDRLRLLWRVFRRPHSINSPMFNIYSKLTSSNVSSRQSMAGIAEIIIVFCSPD